jgi:transposase InsO family protein
LTGDPHLPRLGLNPFFLQYFNFYNFERPHQSLDGKTPAELYFGTAVTLKAA